MTTPSKVGKTMYELDFITGNLPQELKAAAEEYLDDIDRWAEPDPKADLAVDLLRAAAWSILWGSLPGPGRDPVAALLLIRNKIERIRGIKSATILDNVIELLDSELGRVLGVKTDDHLGALLHSACILLRVAELFIVAEDEELAAEIITVADKISALHRRL